ncbi:prolipoprotein diacylglyceryl transferase [Roseivirga sp. BDSF3-8]|uniref:prolipoprotein diacylglyceryl transferase n=1 Tax=Roseivirga sp. BDSF3-8 TaxID=3241598 RepID=UPI0035326EEB
MHQLAFIVWDPIPELPYIAEWLNWPVRWYGLMFVLGFLVSQQIMFYFFNKDGRPVKDVETLTVYMIFATIIGARLGHMFFYDFDRVLEEPLSIFYIHQGGLASHGGAIGILFALWLYARSRKDQSYFWILDRIVIVVALVGALIRFGNFVNSEILGKPTGTDSGVVFAHVAEQTVYGIDPNQEAFETVEARKATSEEAAGLDGQVVMLDIVFLPQLKDRNSIERILQNNIKAALTYPGVEEQVYLPDGKINYTLASEGGQFKASIPMMGVPRHPAQLYESFYCILIFLFLFWLWKTKRHRLPEGHIFALFLIILFSLRFVDEFFKENQEAFEDSLALNMGQILSIPLVLAGIAILIFIHRKKDNKPREVEA